MKSVPDIVIVYPQHDGTYLLKRNGIEVTLTEDRYAELRNIMASVPRYKGSITEPHIWAIELYVNGVRPLDLNK